MTHTIRSTNSTERSLAVVGLGAMGRHHAVNVQRTPGLRLAAVVDGAGDVARESSAALDVPSYADLSAALAHTALDGVVVATPTASHASLVGQALDAGLHVLCEKPIALDADSTATTLAHATRSGLVFHVGLHRRHDADWRAAIARAHDHDLGQLTLLRLTQRIPFEPISRASLDRNGSIHLDTTLHDLDAAVWAVGADPLEISAVAGFNRLPETRLTHDHSDVAVVVLRFPHETLAVIDNCFVAGYGFENCAELIGTDASLRINLAASADRLELLRAGTASRRLALDHIQEHPAAYRAELEHFRDALHGSAPRMSCAAAAAYAAELAWLAAASQRSGHALPVPADLRARIAATTHATESAAAHG